jgi:hypothetical protein
MKVISLSFPELGLIASTRAFLGAGVALLLSDSLNPDQRKAVGWTLFLVGLLSSIPLGILLLQKRDAARSLQNI